MTPSRQQQKYIATDKVKRGLIQEAILDELERNTDEIATLKAGMQEMCKNMQLMTEYIQKISAPEFPEIPVTDLTETNTLLTALLAKEPKAEEPVEVTLKIV